MKDVVTQFAIGVVALSAFAAAFVLPGAAIAWVLGVHPLLGMAFWLITVLSAGCAVMTGEVVLSVLEER